MLRFVLRFPSREMLDAFAAALGQVIARHDIYRTSLAWEGLPEPVQVVWRHAELPVRELVLPAGLDAGPDGAAGLLLAAAGGGVDVRRAPLLGVDVAAEPGTGRWLAPGAGASSGAGPHRPGGDAGRGAGGAGRAGGPAAGPGAVPGLRGAGPARRARDEHERYFAGPCWPM